jgi:hypothetical protein
VLWHRPLPAMIRAYTAAGFRIAAIDEPLPAPGTPRELLPDFLKDKPPGSGFLCFMFFVLEATISLLCTAGRPGSSDTLPRAGASWLTGRADADALQVIVAERAVGVEALEQVSRVGELGIQGVQAEPAPDCPPVRAGTEGREGLLEPGEQADDLPGVVAPGEVQGQRRAPGRTAEPQVVRCDGADLADQQVGRLYVEGDPGDDPERAQPHRHPGKAGIPAPGFVGVTRRELSGLGCGEPGRHMRSSTGTAVRAPDQRPLWSARRRRAGC